MGGQEVGEFLVNEHAQAKTGGQLEAMLYRSSGKELLLCECPSEDSYFELNPPLIIPDSDVLAVLTGSLLGDVCVWELA